MILDAKREALVSHAGSVLLLEAVRATGLDRELGRALAPWRRPGVIHDPAKVVLDLAAVVALGGDCASDLAALRAQFQLFGPVASDPTVSRVIAALAADPETTTAVVAALRGAHAAARATAWSRARPLAGTPGVRAGGQVIVDLDATLVTAYSDKEQAAGTFKKGYGFHPMCAFVDHGEAGTGEVLAINLRRGNAGANKATDLIACLDEALAQLPATERGQVLVRVDGAGGTKDFLNHIAGLATPQDPTAQALDLEYSVGFVTHPGVTSALEALDDLEADGQRVWYDALDETGEPAEHTQVADLSDLIPAPTGHGTSALPWPTGMRVIARRARVAAGEQGQIEDHDGWRVTCFATNTPTTGTDIGDDPGHGNRWAITDLDLRHRQRARGEDRIRCAKDTGLRNLPFQQFDRNRIWVEIVALASDLLTWTQTLAFAGTPHAAARRWEPKTLRFRLLAVAGQIISTGRQQRLRLPRNWPWNRLLDDGYAILTA